MKELPAYFIKYDKDLTLNKILKNDDLEQFKLLIEQKIKEDKEPIFYNNKEDLIGLNSSSTILMQTLLYNSTNISNYLIKQYPDLVYIKGYHKENYLEEVIKQISHNAYSFKELKNKHIYKKQFKSLYFKDPEFYLKDLNNEGNNLLSVAVQYGEKRIAKFLLNNGFDINFINTINGNNLLHIAASNYSKNSELLSFIFNNSKFNYKIDSINKKEETPFLLSVEQQQLQKIQFLIKKGADISVKNINSENALHYFCKCSNYLYSDFREYSYYKKIKEQHSTFINFLIKNGIDINLKDDQGNTPILSLAQNISSTNRVYFIKHLHECGANFDAVNNDGNTILHFLTEKHKFKELYFCINKSNFSINIKNNDNYTPIMMLLKYEYAKQIKDSKSFIKKMMIKDKNKDNKISHLAHSYNSTEAIFKYLLYKGAKKDDIYFPNLLMPWFEDKLSDSNFFKESSSFVINLFEKMNFDFNRIVDNENRDILTTFLIGDSTYRYSNATLEKKLEWLYEKNINFNNGYQYINNPELKDKYLKLQINKEKEILTIAIQSNTNTPENKKTKIKRL